MRVGRTSWLAYSITAAALLASVYFYSAYVNALGFPDGFVSNLDRARRTLAVVFIGISSVVCSCMIVLGHRHDDRRCRQAFAAVLAAYGLTLAGMAWLDHINQIALPGGGGG